MAADFPELSRPAFASPLYRLVETVEVDVAFGEGSATLRVELFRDLEKGDQFRARTYEARRVPLALTEGEEERETAVVLLPWAVPGALVTEEPFVAASVEAALAQVLDDIRTFLLMGAVEG